MDYPANVRLEIRVRLPAIMLGAAKPLYVISHSGRVGRKANSRFNDA